MYSGYFSVHQWYKYSTCTNTVNTRLKAHRCVCLWCHVYRVVCVRFITCASQLGSNSSFVRGVLFVWIPAFLHLYIIVTHNMSLKISSVHTSCTIEMFWLETYFVVIAIFCFPSSVITVPSVWGQATLRPWTPSILWARFGLWMSEIQRVTEFLKTWLTKALVVMWILLPFLETIGQIRA